MDILNCVVVARSTVYCCN